MIYGIQRPGEIVDGGTVRVQAQGLFSGAVRVIHCFLPCSGLIKMIGQVLEVSIMSGRRKVLDGFGKCPMKRDTLAYEKLCIDGLPCQCMPECKAFARFFDDKLSRYQFFHDLEKLMLIILSELLEEGKIKMPSRNGCQGQDVPGRFPQVLCPSMHAILNAARNMDLAMRGAIPVTLHVENIARRDEGGKGFFDEKGIAFRQRVKGIQEFSV